MSSTTIYHYVYRITNIVEKKHYYGKRSSKIEPKLDLGFKYFGSPSGKTNSWIVKDQKINPQNYKYKIIRICNTSSEAQKLESLLHRRFNVDNNQRFYNEVKSSYTNSLGFDPVDKAYVIDQNNIKYYVSRDDERIKSGELFYPNKGTIIVKDTTGLKFRVKLDDPRYISGELVHVNKGILGNDNQKQAASKASANTIPIVDMNGNKFRISINDPGYGTIYMHVATKNVLYKNSSGNTFWNTKNYSMRNECSILYENKGKDTKFVYYTPWGSYDSAGEAAKNTTKFNVQQIKKFCRYPDYTITNKFSFCLKIYPDSIGKTFREIGFYRIEK
jgi:hypothetical protein